MLQDHRPPTIRRDLVCTSAIERFFTRTSCANCIKMEPFSNATLPARICIPLMACRAVQQQVLSGLHAMPQLSTNRSCTCMQWGGVVGWRKAGGCVATCRSRAYIHCSALFSEVAGLRSGLCHMQAKEREHVSQWRETKWWGWGWRFQSPSVFKATSQRDVLA